MSQLSHYFLVFLFNLIEINSMKLFCTTALVIACSLGLLVKHADFSLKNSIPLTANAIAPVHNATSGRLASVGKNSFVINGGGFSNQMKKATNQSNMGWYDTSNKICQVIVGSSTDAVTFVLQFPGNKTGTYKEGAGNIQFYDGKKQTTLYADRNALKMTITRYDALGGLIEGTFSGKYSDMGRKTTVIITDGKFSVTRRKDE
jgi:hypothetical protein